MVDGIFDSHAHYDDDAFDADRDELLRSLVSHGVRRVMNVGSSMESSRTGIQLGKEYDFLYSSVGIHPDSAREICDETLRELAELAGSPRSGHWERSAWITTMRTTVPERSRSRPLSASWPWQRSWIFR